MARTVYMLGAGISRVLRGSSGLEPPLISDFFIQALKHRRISEQRYLRKIRGLLGYIERYWKLSIEDLRNCPFDLEACFTLVQLQKEEAMRSNNTKHFATLLNVERQLTSILAEFLSREFRDVTSKELIEFGHLILEEHAAVLTFNYDTLVESAIERASGKRLPVPNTIEPSAQPTEEEIPDEEIAFSEYNWNRPLAYGVRFNKVRLHQDRVPVLVSGDRFYSHPGNDLYNCPFLKLHGSLNWFTYVTRPEEGR